MSYLVSEVSREPKRKGGGCGMLSEFQQTRRLAIVDRGLAIVNRGLAIVNRGLAIVCERRLAYVRLHILSGLDL